MVNQIYKGKLDLLIIDIDDTFIYHRTVASAYKLFFKSVYTFSIKKFIKLAKTGIYLHILNIIRKVSNRFVKNHQSIEWWFLSMLRNFPMENFRHVKIISCEKMIKIWAKTVVELKIKAEDYKISEKILKKNIYKNIFNIYGSLKNNNKDMYVLAMTESFNVKEDPIKKILDIDEIISNKFIANKGIISKYKINVSKKEDKRRIAEKIIKKIKAKNIGIFVEEYDDIELLKLKNLRFIAYNKRLRRFIPDNIPRIVL